MTPKQAAFVAEYVRTGNGTGAARAAGYSQSSYQVLAQQAADNLNNPQVRAAIAAAGATAVQRVAASTEEAAGGAEYIIRKCIEIVEGGAPARDQIAALSLLSKRLAEWRDGPAVVQQIVQLPAGTSLDELRALAANTRAQLAAPRGVVDDVEE